MSTISGRHAFRLLPVGLAVALAWGLALPVRRLAAQEPVDTATIQRIRNEEMQHPEIMDIMSWLTDVYGPRLTWSPNATRAGEWAMQQMKSWGLTNVHEEQWDNPPGLGWQNVYFAFNAISPNPFIVEAVPRAWSGGTHGKVTGPALLLRAGCLDELRQQYAGRLRHGFIMLSPASDRPVTEFTPPASRYTDEQLAAMAAPPETNPNAQRSPRAAAPPPERSAVCQREYAVDSSAAIARGGRGRRARGGGNPSDSTTLAWLQQQGVAAILLPDQRHTGGDIGTDNGASRSPGMPRVPMVHVAMESYGRIARMLDRKIPVILSLDMENRFFPANRSSFNIIGEIPGTDPALKDQVVMIGGHFDSWHSATGATDNGAGSGVMLEAMRLLKTLDLHPRRTIRIALWTGEEEGLMGSRAYVAQHFGIRDSTGFHPTQQQTKLAAYFNLDNGSGRIRGIYAENIEAERPIFEAWMQPFASDGMSTFTLRHTGGTDHLSFQAAGLPGFQFIQDPLDYGRVTHHANQDLYERLQPDDLKFDAVVLASFAWLAAQRDKILPRPPLPGAPPRQVGGRGPNR